MPIGKNSIKRVANNGYSNVKSTAPDMENSTVEEKKQDKKAAPVPKAKDEKTAAAKKSTAVKKAAPKKSMESEPELAPVNTLKKVTEKTEEKKGDYVNLGGDLPYYLL